MFDPLASPFCLRPPAHLPGPPNWTRHVPFAFALVEALQPATIVELGTHRGTSYLSFCQAVAELQLAARCFAVDTWRGDEHAGEYDSSVLNELKAYHDPRYGEFSSLLQSDFDAAQPQFADRSVDLLHIDGLHTYDAVRHDFERWLPKLSERAVVLLHDVHVKERGFGVWQFWEEACREYGHFSLNHRHGLGVLIVGSQIPARFRELESAARESQGFDSFFDALGQRAELLEENVARRRESAELEARLSERNRSLTEQLQVADLLRAEIARGQSLLNENRTELAAQRERSMAAASKAARDAQAQSQVVAELRACLEDRNLAVATLANEVARLEEYYGHLRFRLAERANAALRKAGWVHDALKAAILSLRKPLGSKRQARA